MTFEHSDIYWNAPLDGSEPVPLWFQIAKRLRAAIDAGEFGPGDVLPSEAQLNDLFGVSRATSRAALNELEGDGLIVRRPGKGSIVVRKQIDQPAQELSGFSEDMRRRGLTPSYRTLETGHFPATAEVAESLEIKPGTLTFRSRRLLLANDKPIGLAVSWIAPPLLRSVVPPTTEALATASLYTWLKNNCGITIGRAHQFIEAASATGAIAEELRVGEGQPILIARRTSYSIDGKPAEYVILNFRADRYRFEIEVTR